MSNREWSTQSEPVLVGETWKLEPYAGDVVWEFMRRVWDAVQRGCVPLEFEFNGAKVVIHESGPSYLLFRLWRAESDRLREERKEDMRRRGIVPLVGTGQQTGAASEDAR